VSGSCSRIPLIMSGRTIHIHNIYTYIYIYIHIYTLPSSAGVSGSGSRMPLIMSGSTIFASSSFELRRACVCVCIHYIYI
jgi:hypothetical protein